MEFYLHCYVLGFVATFAIAMMVQMRKSDFHTWQSEYIQAAFVASSLWPVCLGAILRDFFQSRG